MSCTDLILRSALLRASRRMAACPAVPAAILREGRPSGRPPQDAVRLLSTRSDSFYGIDPLSAELVCKLREARCGDIDRHLRRAFAGAGPVLARPSDMAGAQAILRRRLEIVAMRRRHHAFRRLDVER